MLKLVFLYVMLVVVSASLRVTIFYVELILEIMLANALQQ
jgi:hypothetical protein